MCVYAVDVWEDVSALQTKRRAAHSQRLDEDLESAMSVLQIAFAPANGQRLAQVGNRTDGGAEFESDDGGVGCGYRGTGKEGARARCGPTPTGAQGVGR